MNNQLFLSTLSLSPQGRTQGFDLNNIVRPSVNAEYNPISQIQ